MRRAGDDTLGIAFGLCNLSTVVLDRGDIEQAATFLAESLPILQEYHERDGMPGT